MKRLLLFLMTVFCVISIYAQNTYLEVDNQVPGQLSTKIMFVDQVSICDLTVTGYINKSDFAFIGTLISQRNLHGTLDLSNANVVSTIASDDNYLSKNVFSIYDAYLRKIILPKSLTKIDKEWYTTLTIDSIVFDTRVKEVSTETFHNAKYLFVGNSVEIIPQHFTAAVDFIEINDSIKILNDFACEGSRLYCSSNSSYEFKELEYLGYHAFFNKDEYLPDTLLFPNIIDFHTDGLKLRSGMHIYLGENTKKVYRDPKIAYTNRTRQDINGVNFHIASLVPPGTVSNPSWTQDINLYVPKDAVEIYKNDGAWKFANIFAEPQHVSSLAFNTHELNMEIGEEINLCASIYPDNADDNSISWISLNESVATVDDCGKVTATGGGKTMVCAISNDNPDAKDYCEVTVTQPVTGITLNETTLTMTKPGESVQLTATVQPENASNKEVRWSSSNANVCTVSDNGFVSSVGSGTCVITATSVDGGYTAECAVTVMQPVTEVKLYKHETTLKVGESEELRVDVLPSNADDKSLSWQSEDDSIVTVDENGKIAAVGAGKTKVWAISNDNPDAKDYCEVTVTQPVTGITLSETAVTMTSIGESVQLTAIVQPEDASNKEVGWSSSNTAVCMVSGDGLVIALGEGTSVVTATTMEGGYIGICVVTVTISDGITKITVNELLKSDIHVDVYDTNGTKVASNIPANTIKKLPKGIYFVCGMKIVVK